MRPSLLPLSFFKDSQVDVCSRHLTIRKSLALILPLFVFSGRPLVAAENSRAEYPASSIIAISRLAAAESPTDAPAAKISDVQLRELSGDANLTFKLSVLGENLGDKIGDTNVLFTTKDPTRPVQNVQILSVARKEIVVQATAPAGTEITAITAVVRGESVSTKGFTVSFKPNPPPPALREFQIKFDHEISKEYPNLHSLVATKEGGDNGVGFDVKPSRMSIELEPTGAIDLRIVQSNEQQLVLNFVAAADYVPKNIIITVYDSSDLELRRAVALAKPSTSTSPSDPQQPKINGIETVFLIRRQGIGRIRILGKGFGDYPLPPFPADEYLINCLERAWIFGADQQAKETVAYQDKANKEKAEVCKTLTKGNNELWPAWQESIRGKVMVGITSRNEDIRPEKVFIINANDSVIDVYFEFTKTAGYSQPFRLSNADLVITKTQQKTKQTVKTEKVTATVVESGETTYDVTQDIGPKHDATLTYSYTVLDSQSANVLLGKGISKNFYVLKVTVVNNGTKKVSVPLGAIQAEIEWALGNKSNSKQNSKISYVDGPPTMAPIPLAAVSAYFSAYNHTKGTRTIMFNSLDALTTLAAAMVPYVGPSFKSGYVVFTGGFIPGLHKVIGDMSAEQLQNLTGLSWETTETLSPGGGTIEKFIYFLKNEQFADKPIWVTEESKQTGQPITVSKQTKKQITNIIGLEVTGYDVNEGDTKQATPTGTKSTPTATTTPATPASGAAAKPASP